MTDKLLPWVEAQWSPIVDAFDWEVPPKTVWTPAEALPGNWFAGGLLDPLWNLLGRHTRLRDAPAVKWEGEPGDTSGRTYGELEAETAALMRGLRSLGVEAGDSVALCTGGLPETIVAMLACTGIGASWAVLPTTLQPEALAERLVALSPKVVFTQDAAWRRGTILPLKHRMDEALGAVDTVEATVVVKRLEMAVPWFEGDVWYHDLLLEGPSRPEYRREAAADEPTSASPSSTVCADRSPFLSTMLIAGPGEEPILANNPAIGTLMNAYASTRLSAGQSMFWCAADVSWAVTLVHGILGPLLRGATLLLYEGTLDVPDHERLWKMLSTWKVETILTHPSVLRKLYAWAPERPVHDTASLRTVITAGEPLETGLRDWMAATFQSSGVEVIDAWGQVMLGGLAIAHSKEASLPDLGELSDNADDIGEMLLRYPSPAMVTEMSGPGAQALLSNYTRHPGFYATGDLVANTDDGFVYHGRADAMTSFHGTFVSLDAIRHVIEQYPYVVLAEACVLDNERERKEIAAAIVLRSDESRSSEAGIHNAGGPSIQSAPTASELEAVAADIRENIKAVLGGTSTPSVIAFVDRLPRASRAALSAGLLRLVPAGTSTASLKYDDIKAAARS